MTVSIGALSWQDTAQGNKPIAPYTVSFASDANWQFNLSGMYHLSPISPRGVQVDNSANKNPVTVIIGPLTTSVAPFSQTDFTLGATVDHIQLSCASAQSVGVTFYIDPSSIGLQVGTNSYAIQATVAATVAGYTLAGVSPIVNGEFRVNQNPGVSPGGVWYVAEGWCNNAPAGQANVVFGAGTLGQSQSACVIGRVAGNANTTTIQLGQALLSSDSYQFVGNQISLAFDLGFLAGFPAGGQLTAQILAGTGTDQNVFSMTGSTVIGLTNFPYSTASARVNLTSSGTVPANTTQIGVVFSYTPVGAAGANEAVSISRVQLDSGAVQGYRPTPLPIEQDRCLYFYEQSNIAIAYFGYQPGNGLIVAGNQAQVSFPFRRKRATPTITLNNPGAFAVTTMSGGSLIESGVTGLLSVGGTPDGATLQLSLGTAATVGAPCVLNSSSGNAGVITISARL